MYFYDPSEFQSIIMFAHLSYLSTPHLLLPVSGYRHNDTDRRTTHSCIRVFSSFDVSTVGQQAVEPMETGGSSKNRALCIAYESLSDCPFEQLAAKYEFRLVEVGITGLESDT